jgi:hypothetical protein
MKDKRKLWNRKQKLCGARLPDLRIWRRVSTFFSNNTPRRGNSTVRRVFFRRRVVVQRRGGRDPARRSCLKRVMDEGVVSQSAKGLIDYWSRRTIAGLLLMSPTRHDFTQLNQACRLKQKFVV